MKILYIFLAVTWLWYPSVQAAASDAEHMPKIVMITWRGETRAEKGFEKGIRDFGYDPQYIKLHCNQDLERLNRLLPQIKKEAPDLIYVFGTTATRQVMATTTTCPVIFNIVTRPVESGIIANWHSSGNNATGVSSMVPIPSQIKALQKVVKFTRLGVIYNPLENNSTIQVREIEMLSRRQGFELSHFKISRAGDVDRALKDIGDRVDAVYLPSDSTIKTLGKQIMTRVNAHRLPSLAALEEMVVSDGAMMGLVPDYYQLGSLAARKAHAVLQGNRPSDIPAVTSDHFNITINLNTARKIGINIPTAVLVMADKIVR